MEKTNAKQLTPEEQCHLRKQVILLRKKGIANGEVAEILELSESHCSRIWTAYWEEGPESIGLKRRGRKDGEKRLMTTEQEESIRRMIIDKTPEQLKFDFMLWTREAVRQLIKRQFKIEMALTSVGNYLKRWGFTVQKPIKVAYEQNPERVKKWMEEEYPAIQAKAKAEEAIIYWGDETGIQNGANVEKGYAPKGNTPIARIAAKKEKISMVSAISNQGLLRFMLYDEGMTSERLVEFMKRLVKDSNQKVLLILDNLRTHHSKVVQAWLEKSKEKIEVFYLPPYSPQANPDEYLNNDLKRSVHSGSPARTKAQLTHKTRSFLKRLQRRPAHVCSYFRHKNLRYINCDI
jgi:transposase